VLADGSVTTALDPVRSAVARGDWRAALGLLDAAGPAADAPEGLELRAQAAYAHGDFEAAITSWERLHEVARASGDPEEAARVAAMIAMYLLVDTGLMAPVRGWVARAERLLDEHDDSPVRALLAMVRAYERFMSGDPERVLAHAADAVELGRRHGVTPAVVLGQVATARVWILEGRVDEGLELLDEVGTRLMAGEVDPLTTGMMYCELVCAAQALGLHDRATEWTGVMERWRHGAAYAGIHGRCRVHRAELLRTSGPGDLAEEEALGACADLRPWLRREYGWPLVELGTIRLRRGDLAGAEDAFLGAHEHAWSPQPGLALLRLAQGDDAEAAALVADAIDHPLDMPSKEQPPFGDLRLAPLLAAQVEIAAARDDAATAERAAGRLAAIADRFSGPLLAASAALALGRAALLRGDLRESIARCSAAVSTWSEADAPYDAAEARLVLAEALRREGREERARLEWGAARAAYAAFGALSRLAEVDRLLGAAQPRADQPATGAHSGVFRRTGDTRTIGFAGRDVVLQDLKGMRYVARLLRDPGREVHVLDLAADEGGPVLPQQGLPVLDEEARAAYRRRLREVEEDLDEAQRDHDLARQELAERDRDYLIAELSRAVGLGGRARTVGGDAERARTSVTRSIRYAIARVGEHHPTLAAHLDRAVRTGTYCCYVPDPVAPVQWDL
jgi:tetratricopeptide (TPR) repeat protein